ncbi:MAG: YeeE/YedE family protein [Helicobacteraceae bacterium]|nr:YeeE/YedE family protein [Helicobacteraceae bacterium]
MKWRRITAVMLAAGCTLFAFFSVDILEFCSAENPRATSFAFLCGLALGVTMQRSRFCFYCHLREWFEERNPHGALALLLAITIGIVGYTIVIGGWLPNPAVPSSIIHVGPANEIVILAGFVFGLGMTVSGSCVAAHWYHFAGGSLYSLAALIGVSIGFFLGFNSWNALYSYRLAEAPIVWLPAYLGYGGALCLQLGVIFLLALFLWRGFSGQSAAQTSVAPLTIRGVWRRLWETEWNYWIGGLLVGLIAIAAIIRVKPLGATAAIASWTRSVASRWGLIPDRLNGLDTFAGCGSLPQNFWLNADSLLLLGLVSGALIASLASGKFSIEGITPKETPQAILGGVLLGWGAMTALGCTIGTLLSGTHAGALSGWLFGAAMLFAIYIGLKIKRGIYGGAEGN